MSICAVSVCAMSICVMSICVHSYPERNLHTASRQTRKPERHQRKIFAPAIGAASPNAIYTQQAAKPACQQDINAKKSRISYWHSYPERNLHTTRTPATQKSSGQRGGPRTPKHTSDPLGRCSKSHAYHAKAATERRRPNDAKAYIRPPADAPCARLQRKSSGRPAETKRRQSVHQTPCRCTKSHASHAKTQWHL